MFVILLYGCKTKDAIKLKSIEIDISSMNVEPMENIIEISDTIKLEATSSSLIGVISRVIFHKNNIYIADFKNDKLISFSNDGSFLQNIGAKGRAGNEYIGIDDFFIKNDTIFLYDFNGSKFLKFTTSGEFINTVKISTHFSAIRPMPISDEYVVLNTFSNSDNNPKFSWLNSDFIVESSCSDQRENGIALPNTFYQYKDFFIYYEMFNDTIYSVSPYTVSPKYFIDFKNYSVPSKIKNIEDKIDYYTKNYLSTATFINNVIEIEDKLSFSFAHNLTTFWALYNKNNNILRIFKLAKNGEYNTLQHILMYNEDSFIGVYMSDNIAVNNNPYLIKLKLKN